MVWRFPQKVVWANGFRLEPSCGRPGPQTKFRTERGTSAGRVVGAKGFEPSTSWSRTRRASQAALRPDRHAQPHSSGMSETYRLTQLHPLSQTGHASFMLLRSSAGVSGLLNLRPLQLRVRLAPELFGGRILLFGSRRVSSMLRDQAQCAVPARITRVMPDHLFCC